MIFKD